MIIKDIKSKKTASQSPIFEFGALSILPPLWLKKVIWRRACAGNVIASEQQKHSWSMIFNESWRTDAIHVISTEFSRYCLALGCERGCTKVIRMSGYKCWLLCWVIVGPFTALSPRGFFFTVPDTKESRERLGASCW